jgi:hypothetical protein
VYKNPIKEKPFKLFYCSQQFISLNYLLFNSANTFGIFKKVFQSFFICFNVFLLSASSIIAQNNSLEITFTAIDSTSWVQLDSIRVMNRNQGADTLLHWPDTVLILDYPVGIADGIQQQDGFRLFQIIHKLSFLPPISLVRAPLRCFMKVRFPTPYKSSISAGRIGGWLL